MVCLRAILLLIIYLIFAHAQQQPSDLIWQLRDVDHYRSTRNPSLGYQNFTWCCIKAVSEALEVVDGALELRYGYEDWISVESGNVSDLVKYTDSSLFPCTATYVEGINNGTPVVQVPYEWISDICPGWQLSDKTNLNAWLQPLSGFLLPAVIFCLSVPRRRKIGVPRRLFISDLSRTSSYFVVIPAALAAGIIVSVDTIIWLCACFAFAGPMILSRLYEALLDKRMLDFTRERTRNKNLTLDMRCRILMIILIGNLDLGLEESQNGLSQNAHPQASPWQHMEELLYPIRLFDDDNPARGLSPRQKPSYRTNCPNGPECDDMSHRTTPRPRTAEIEKQIQKTKTRLRTMLHCQYSFGSLVGAPVIFFLGGFIFALLQSLTIIGDEDAALGLAFGQWYMTIPHIAIVLGLLLAGNNPNILEGVLAKVQTNTKHHAPGFWFLRFELAYPSCYRAAWQWQRGPTKRRWIKQLIDTYLKIKDGRCRQQPHILGESIDDDDIKELRKRTTLSIGDWTLVLSLTVILIGLPFILAFMAAYYTPEVGVSCRSLSIAIYGSVQFGQILLWLWAYSGPPKRVKNNKAMSDLFCKDGWLDKCGFYSPTSLEQLMGRDPEFMRRETWWERTVPCLWSVTWYALSSILLIVSVFAAVGGTVMQLLGLYTANICRITTGNWFAPLSERPFVTISLNSPDRIASAHRYWVPCAATAIAFMVVVSFMAWWYQRRMRDMFTDIVSTIDKERWDCSETARSHHEGKRQGLIP